MKPLLALVLSLLIGGQHAGATPDRAALIRLASSVWKVEVHREQGGYAIGSGVAVAADQVLTNCHVTRDGQLVHVLRGGQRLRAEAQAVDAEHDLCLLRVPDLGATPVALGSSHQLRPGQSVVAFGYTGGQDLQFNDGQVVALHRLDGGRVVQSSNAFTSGASGGALFDTQLRLVGILTFRLRGGVAHYFSAPVEWLQRLREDATAFSTVRPLPPGAHAYWERAPAAQPNFLRAAVLERERRWDELEALAFNWARVDADDPQPWYLHGLALDGLQRWAESQRALERSVLLEPASQLAWFRLGMVHTERGQLEQARQVRGRLEGLQSELAGELGRAIEQR